MSLSGFSVERSLRSDNPLQIISGISPWDTQSAKKNGASANYKLEMLGNS